MVCRPPKGDQIVPILCSLGMVTIDASPIVPVLTQDVYCVMLDGKVVGYIPRNKSALIAEQLRSLKVRRETVLNGYLFGFHFLNYFSLKLNKFVPMYTEICLVEQTDVCSLYPGLYLFTTPARMMRPVRNLVENSVEYIGTFEQVRILRKRHSLTFCLYLTFIIGLLGCLYYTGRCQVSSSPTSGGIRNSHAELRG